MTFQKSPQKCKLFASFNCLGNSIDFLMKIARFLKDFMTDLEVNCFIVVDRSSITCCLHRHVLDLCAVMQTQIA